MTDHTALLEIMASDFIAAKREEDDARKKRIRLEEEIIKLTGMREEGSETHAAGDYKITVTGKMTRTLDADIWADIEHSIPEAMRPVIYKPSIEIKGLRYLEMSEPDIYRIVSKAISAKPAKAAISIKGTN